MLKPAVGLLCLLVCVSALAEKNINRVHIAAPITSVYLYVTQPDKWNDWHPQSKSALTPGGSLLGGQVFSEVVFIGEREMEFDYVVTEAQMPVAWAVDYKSQWVVGKIHYSLQETIDGTLLTRTLEYFPRPENPQEKLALEKLAVHVQPAALKALRNLKENLEADWQGRQAL